MDITYIYREREIERERYTYYRYLDVCMYARRPEDCKSVDEILGSILQGGLPGHLEMVSQDAPGPG